MERMITLVSHTDTFTPDSALSTRSGTGKTSKPFAGVDNSNEDNTLSLQIN